MCLKTDVWVLCRTYPIGHPPGLIVVPEKDYNFWAATYQQQYEFVAKGRYSLMHEYKKLMKETA